MWINSDNNDDNNAFLCESDSDNHIMIITHLMWINSDNNNDNNASYVNQLR